MSLQANAIVTVAELRTYLGKAEDAVRQDDVLELAINLTSDQIEEFIGGPVVVQTYTDQVYDGRGGNVLRLDQGPVTGLKTPGLSDLQYRTSPDEAWQNLEETLSYILFPQDDPWAVRLFQRTFYEGTQNIKISFKAGYTKVPGTIRRVCLEAAAIFFKESGKGGARIGVDSQGNTQGGQSGSTTFSRLTADHLAALRPFRRIVL